MNFLALLLVVICSIAMVEALDSRTIRFKQHRKISSRPHYNIRKSYSGSMRCHEESDCPDDRICDDGFCLNVDQLFEKYDNSNEY
ncbi:unnamed protein product [Caenorhabditis bovis]|uniref:Uncharacterized protein n=1 Tax=Caenorhabditis bovis TaxID=2654633 RepID=A0A8S1EBQ7_9PELO|nr:unnamed protein product [Caenorhabditis bovis]